MQVIGLSTEAQADAVREEGLTTLDDFSSFDDERIKILCASVRKPGGLFPDPNAPAPVVGRGARNKNQAPPAMIANPAFYAGGRIHHRWSIKCSCMESNAFATENTG